MSSDNECPPPPFDPSTPPKTVVVERLDRAGMIEFARTVYHPKGLSPDEATWRLVVLCANCPDPAGAMEFITELQREEFSMEELVDRLLSCPERRVEDVPTSELPSYNPLRGIKLSLE